MPSILFKCPSGGIHAHAWIADDARITTGPNEYIAIDCSACRRIHYFDPATSTLLGGEKVSVSEEGRAGVKSAPPSVEIEPQPFPSPYRNIALAVIAIALLGWVIVAATFR